MDSSPAGLAILAALAAVGLGVTVWVMLPATRGPDEARRDVGTHRLAIGCIVAVFVLNALMTLPFVDLLRDDGGLSPPTFAIAALSTQIPMLLVVYIRLIWPRAVTWQELGLRPLPLERVLRVGILTGFGGLVMTIVVEMALSQFGFRPNQMEQFAFIRQAGPLAFAVVLVLVTVTAPFTEELFFRGFLFGLYRRRQPLWVAYAASGALFASPHLIPMRMNLSQMVGLAVGVLLLATLLAWTYQRTGSLFPAMVAHAVNNATAVVALYAAEGR